MRTKTKMVKQQKSDLPPIQLALTDVDCGYRPVPQAFWDEWLKCFEADVPEPSLSEQLTVLQVRTAHLPEWQQKELAVVIRNATENWAQEKLDGLSRSEESD